MKIILEELSDEELDILIRSFKNSCEKINYALLNGLTVDHNQSELKKAINFITKNITKDYSKLRKNFDLKYKELICLMEKYNKLVYIYNSKNKEKIENLSSAINDVKNNITESYFNY